jgi:hypothetical protein
MPGLLSLYALSDHGVDRVSTPVHVANGAWLSAQNLTTSESDGRGGVRKRLGLRKLHSSGAAGTILAMLNVPVTDPSP